MAEREQVFIEMLAIIVKHSNAYFSQYYSRERVSQDIYSCLYTPSSWKQSLDRDDQIEATAVRIEYRYKVEAAVGLLKECKKTMNTIFIGNQSDREISTSSSICVSPVQQLDSEEKAMSSDVKSTKDVTQNSAEEKNVTSTVVTENEPELDDENGAKGGHTPILESTVPNADSLASEVVTGSEKEKAVVDKQPQNSLESAQAADATAPEQDETTIAPQTEVHEAKANTASGEPMMDNSEQKSEAGGLTDGAVVKDESLTELANKSDSTQASITTQKENTVMTMTAPSAQAASAVDAKKLWNNIKSDPTLPYHKKDQDSKLFDVNDTMRLVAASVRGRSHAHKGLHRDDDFELHHPVSDGWSILAVADGAGSCEYSRRGSQIAVQKSVEKLREALSSPLGQELLDNYPKDEGERTAEKKKIVQDALYKSLVAAAYAASEEIKKEADTGGNPPKLYSTTLLLAAHKERKDGHIIISFWIGDGAIALYQEDGALELLGQPDGGEYAGQTRFLDDKIFRDPGVISRVRICLRDNFTALILATDGITDPLFESDSQLAQKQPWDKMWKELSPIINKRDGRIARDNLVKWAGFYSPGNHDDRTIALLAQRKAGSHD